MKTIVYIDGFNLYFGLLKNTSFKWLNLPTLITEIVKIQNPNSNVEKIKYFTAPVKANFSIHKEKAPQSQNHYHRALLSVSDNKLEIINGYFDIDMSSPVLYSNPVDLNNRVNTWKLEEKQTDVNIAIEMYRDAAKGAVKQQVLVSSDSDIIPALRYIKKDFSDIDLGLILPRKKQNKRRNSKLSQVTDWTRNHINDDELEKHQLPNMVPTHKKPIYKPKYW